MGARPEGGLLKELVHQFPYTAPGDLYPDPNQHTWLWNLALREGRQQVIQWIAEHFGAQLPTPDYSEDSHVFSAEDRSSTSADASASRRSGSEHP
jgi:hypothetical protein